MPNPSINTTLALMLGIAMLAVALLGVGATAALGQINEGRPDGIEGVGIDDKRGDQIPLDLEFTDQDGKRITLADLFNGERPILLSLNYSDCPMLCRVQLNGLVEALKEIEWTAGEEFQVVSVSIDPRERPERAKQTQERYLTDYARAGAADGWKFLTGNQENIAALARAVGFRYKFMPDTGEFSHTAAVMVVTPDGVVSRYLYGVMYEPQTLRLSMVEAGDGKVGSAMDQILLFCFHYDETKGRYGPVARRIMSAGGALTVVVVAACLLPFWLRRGKPGDPANGPQSPPTNTAPKTDAADSPEPIAT